MSGTVLRPVMVAAMVAALVSGAAAQTGTTAAKDGNLPARELFGAKDAPADMRARAIGTYARGCLAGAVALPVTSEAWQVMRLSRNRNWGHPNLIAVIERLAEQAPKLGWRGLLVGDLAQPRGGPMLTGHVSHQIGLDADIWLTPMPDRVLSDEEREKMTPINLVAPDWKDIDPDVWTPAHLAIIRAAALDRDVDRVLVNAAIKRGLCRDARGDRRWLSKVRPFWGHNYHMHIRIRCPQDSPDCRPQDPPPAGDGCGAELDWWFSAEARRPPTTVVKRPPVRLAELPAACRSVLMAP